jgi:sulfur-oxidizing protein SoxA
MENPAFLPARAAHVSLSTLLGAMVFAAFPATCDARSEPAAPASVPMDLTQPASATPWFRHSGWPATDWKDYNTLARTASPSHAPPPKLGTPITGDAKNGEKLAYDRERGGSCVACHVMGKTTPELPGNVGPDLSTVGSSGRPDQWLFDYVYDARSINPNSMMPPWGAHRLFSVQEILDIVTFMKTLTEPHIFKDDMDNPATRPVPVDTRDNLDPFVNDGMAAVERGGQVYSRVGATGKSCVSCHAAPEKSFKSWAATMPRYETRLKKVIGVEEFITRHARSTTGENLLMQSPDNIDLSVYLRHLANGTPIKIDTTSKDAVAAIKRGNALMRRKIGQLNFACIDCHSLANKWVRGQWLAESSGHAVFNKEITHFPTFRTSEGAIWDLRKRIQWCNVAVRANELPPDAVEYGDIELALTALNQGQNVNVPGIRN